MFFLKSACCLTVFTGIISVLGSFEPTQLPWLILHNLLSSSQNSRASFSEDALVLNAIVGGLMMGWGTLMFLLADECAKSIKIWRAMVAGLVVWFFFDSLGSVLSGVYLNVVLNICFITVFIIPLMAIKPNIAISKVG